MTIRESGRYFERDGVVYHQNRLVTEATSYTSVAEAYEARAARVADITVADPSLGAYNESTVMANYPGGEMRGGTYYAPGGLMFRRNRYGQFVPVSRQGSPGVPALAGGYGSGGYGSGGYGSSMFEFPTIEALPPIDVSGILSEIGELNRGTFKTNTGLADTAARRTTAGIFDDFQGFVEELLPGQGELVRSSVRTVQEFIDTGLPRAVQSNALARDAAALAAGGVRGTIGANRLLYNEAQRDIAGIQYGIGAAQQMVQQAQSVAGQFSSMQANLGSNYLGQLNQLTTITPAQGIGFAFDERAYQTGVQQFNATGQWNATSFGASYGLQSAQLGLQQQQFAWQQQQARDAQKASEYGALGSILGFGAGVLSGGGLIGGGLGAMIGGGLGNIAGGNYAGGTSQLLGGIGSYAGYQMQMDQLQLQQRQMGLMERSYGYQPGFSSAPWAPVSTPSSGYGYGGGMTTFGDYGYGFR